MSTGAYRTWAALTYEIARRLCEARPSLSHHPIVRALLEHTRGDWITWRTELTLREVDAQIAALHQQWDQDDARNAPVIADDGKELRIRAPWFDPAPYTNEPAAPDQPR